MRSRRLEVLAFAAMLFAMLALFVALQSNSRADDGPGGNVPAPAEAAQAAQAPQATIPSTFNYQGFLRNPDGSLVTGSFNITLKIYNQAASGTLLHQEAFTAVPVRDGLFNVVLGDGVALPATLFTNNAPLFIGVSIGANPELIPRQRVHPVPWALQASALVPNTTVQGLTGNAANLALNGTTAMDDMKIYKYAPGGLTAFETTGANGPGFIFGTPGGWRFQVNTTDTITYNKAQMWGGANVAGSLTLNDKTPIIAKRFRSFTGNRTIDTGINYNDYYCTPTGWYAQMDVNEIGTGTFARWSFGPSAAGTWSVNFWNYTQGNPLNDLEVICFYRAFFNQLPDSVAAADGTFGPTGDLPNAPDSLPQPTDASPEIVQ